MFILGFFREDMFIIKNTSGYNISFKKICMPSNMICALPFPVVGKIYIPPIQRFL